jgi:hypothetical protein
MLEWNHQLARLGGQPTAVAISARRACKQPRLFAKGRDDTQRNRPGVFCREFLLKSLDRKSEFCYANIIAG